MMKITILTPSLNQCKFIEKNILSVLNQYYDNFEHIIIDGGSTDNTVKILMKYSHLKWISEKDNGQSNALNKGLNMATGEVVGWINSDDELADGALLSVYDFFLNNPNELAVSGELLHIDDNGKELFVKPSREYIFKELLNKYKDINQQSTFFKKTVFDSIGYLREDLHYAMDYDLFLRFTSKQPIKNIPIVLAKFRRHDQAKTTKNALEMIKEQMKVRKKYHGKKLTPAGIILIWHFIKVWIRLLIGPKKYNMLHIF